MPNEKTRTKAKIIPFERDGEFFLRRGSQRLERNDLLEAAASYRQACRKEPDNVEYQLALAEVLTEMHRYEESNRLLFPLLSLPEFPSECYFGMACNFFGLQEFHHAHDSLESYLSLDPDGPFSYDAVDMLDALESDDELYSIPGVLPQREQDAQAVCSKSRHLMENGDIKQAISTLKAASARYPDLTFVRNNLAMAYFCNHQSVQAMEEVQAILERNPEDVQAHCNRLLFLHDAKRPQEDMTDFAFLQQSRTQDPDDLNRMAVTFMELGHYQEALGALKRLQAIFPYDESANHRMGVCYYQLKQYAPARDCYDRLLKIDSDDTIAKYYRVLCQKAILGKPEPVDWMHHYQVPYVEVLRRIRAINSSIKREQKDLARLWEQDRDFHGLLLWGLRLPEPVAKRALLSLIFSFGGQDAEYALRDFLLDSSQPDAIKREVFGLLRQMGAKEPYVAIMDGQLVQSRSGLSCQVPENLPPAYQRILAVMLESMAGTRSPDCMEAGVAIYERYIKSLGEGRYPRLTKGQVYALAAAIEYLACHRCPNEQGISKGQLCSAYGISLTRLNNALSKLHNIMDTEEEH